MTANNESSNINNDDMIGDDVENNLDLSALYGIRRPLRETNWLYRPDALRPGHIREAHSLFDIAESLMLVCIHVLAYAESLSSSANQFLSLHLEELYRNTKTIATKAHALAIWIYMHAYFYFLDAQDILFYPIMNRNPPENRFPPLQFITIIAYTENDAKDFTNFNLQQLRKMLLHWRIPHHMRYSEGGRVYSGEECFLYYLYFLRNGHTYLAMGRVFGGDPRRFTDAIRVLTDHLYNTFYHKISGNSLEMWKPYLSSFRLAIWQRLVSNSSRREMETDGIDEDNDSFLEFPFNQFRIFGFLDDYGILTTRPGDEVRREENFDEDLQRSFYSAYFSGHGLKVQAVLLPNGMIGSVYITSLRQSDSGVVNISGLNDYLTDLLRDAPRILVNNVPQFPALYGDAIFSVMTCIVPRYQHVREGSIEHEINLRMASLRMCIEHSFGDHHNLFKVFHDSDRFRLLGTGYHARKVLQVSFFVLNCYYCFNESSAHFPMRPLTFEQYLPLHEDLPPAPGLERQGSIPTIYHRRGRGRNVNN